MENSGNKAEKFSSVNSFSSHHDQAGEDERNEVADTSFRNSLLSYCSVEGQLEKFPSTSNLVPGEIEEEDEETGLLGKNHSHKHENMVTQRKEEASPQNDLLIDINRMIKTARPLSSSKYCCIYKVTPILREVNQTAYTPQVVSIGPLHRKNEKLKGMEEVKIRYLEQFLLRAAKTAMLEDFPKEDQKAFLNSKDVDTEKLNDFSCLHMFLDILRSSKEKIRESYSEDLNHLTSNDLLKIILVDAAFIIEFFLRGLFGSEGDVIFSSSLTTAVIRLDLGLLENQVPFFVLEELYRAAFGSYIPNIYPPFLNIARRCFAVYDDQKIRIEREILHFTDLLRTLLLPIPKDEEERRNAGAPEENYSGSILKIFTDFLRYWGLLSRSGRKHKDQKEPSFYLGVKQLDEHLKTATQLHAAGVEFTVSSSECLLDINFSVPRLEIPCLLLDEEIEIVFRNLMALGQYCYPEKALFCDYVTVMDYLINTREDVELLVEKKIIKNWLGSNEEAASLFNRLRQNIIKGSINSRFHSLIYRLNAYYAKPWNRWKATFWRQYFSTPWRSASTIAAVILLVLTLAQTILTVVPMYRGGRQ